MPSVPIEMPSDTPIVLKRMPTQFDAATPSFTCPPRSCRCMLHGLPSYQTASMPSCGLFRSTAVKPVAISIAWLAPWLAGWVLRLEYLLSFPLLAGGVIASVVMGLVVVVDIR